MNPFDHAVLGFINSFARQSVAFDQLVGFVNRNDLLKGGIIMALVWWGWFKTSDSHDRREAIVAAMLSGFMALVAGRLLASFLPFRLRPLHDPAVHFILPYGASANELKLWSSFPSQHTLFFSALGVGMMYISWIAGVFILVHTALFIALPRVYLGFHFPSDIVAGFVIGAVVAMAMNLRQVRHFYAARVLAWHDRHPSAFYAMFFILTLQLSTMFSGAIDLLKLIVHGARAS